MLIAKGVAVTVVLEIAGAISRAQMDAAAEPEFDDADPEALTFLNLGPAAGTASAGNIESATEVGTRQA